MIYYSFKDTILSYGLTDIEDAMLSDVTNLLALIGHNPNDIYDFENHKIIPEGLGACWQTGNTTRATALLFSLWNDYNNEYNCGTVYNIFGCSRWDKYYIEALKLYCSNSDMQIPSRFKIKFGNRES